MNSSLRSCRSSYIQYIVAAGRPGLLVHKSSIDSFSLIGFSGPLTTGWLGGTLQVLDDESLEQMWNIGKVDGGGKKNKG